MPLDAAFFMPSISYLNHRAKKAPGFLQPNALMSE